MKQVLIGIFILFPFLAHCQTKLDSLLNQRKELYKNYLVLKENKSSFWRTQSKDDLRKIITNLKEIIKKDDEIFREVNYLKEKKIIETKQASQQTENDLSLKDRNLSNQVIELSNEIESLNSLLKKSQKNNLKLNKEIQENIQENLLLEKILGILLVILLILLLLLIFYNRKHKKNVSRKKTQRK